MSSNRDGSVSAMQHRINAEIQDNLDEDLELELEVARQARPRRRSRTKRLPERHGRSRDDRTLSRIS
jgi:hypothetical protein